MFTGFQPDYALYKNTTFVAQGGETTIPLTINGNSMVVRNGVFLYPDLNYTRNSGTNQITLVDPVSASAGDVFITLNLGSFKVADTYSKDEMNARIIPVGAIMAFAGSTVEPGWLECDGSLEDQLTYPTLFAKIGHAYKKVRPEIDSYMPLNGNAIDLASYRDKTTLKGSGAGFVSAAGAFGATQVFQSSTTGGLTSKLGSGFNRSAWTIEGYWKAGTGSGTNRHIFMLGDAWSGAAGVSLSVYTDNRVYFYLNSTNPIGTSTLTLSDQNLHHIAVSYDGTNYRIFIDGTLFVTAPGAAIPSSFNGLLGLNWVYGSTPGLVYQQASQYSNWLVTSGSAKYTTAFTPSATAWDILETIPNGKFRRPDLRGESLRGWDHGRGIDSFNLRPIGSWQEDDVKSHTHGMYYTSNIAGGGSTTVPRISADAGTDYPRNDFMAGFGGQDTRPRNIAVMFCIKAADSVTDSGLINSANLAARVNTLESNVASRAFRNKLINGNFDIWQRNISQSTVGYGSADRWMISQVGSTMSLSRQSFLLGQTDVPGSPDFYAQVAVTSVAGAANYTLLRQNIESVKTLANGKAVVHFWAKADTTRNIAVELVQNFGGYIKAIAPQVIQLSNTWKRFELTFTIPNITGEIVTANQDCLVLSLWLESGANYASRAGNIGQQSGTFSFARVQVESGNATPFEDRPIATELALCQRYFEKSYPQSVFPGTNVGVDTSAWPGMQVWGSGAATANQYGTVTFKVTKRVTPTLTTYCSTGVSGKMSTAVGQAAATVGAVSDTSSWVATATAASWNGIHWTADSEL